MNVGVLNAVGHSNMANVSYAIEIISEMFTIGSNRQKPARSQDRGIIQHLLGIGDGYLGAGVA
jgi:hypothetical protein